MTSSGRKKQARRKRTPRAAPGEVDLARTSRDGVLVVGTTHVARSVTRAIKKTGIPVERVDALRGADPVEPDADFDVACLVFVPPAPLHGVGGELKAALAMAEDDIPTFVVVGETVSDRLQRWLYGVDVVAVLQWPEDRLALLGSLLSLHPLARSASGGPSDRELARLIQKRLKADRAIARLDVKVVAGIAMLRGEVDALWKRDEAEKAASSVPGVRDVIAGGVRVVPPRIADRSVAARVRKMLDSASAVDPSTIGVDVTDGVARIAGSVKDRKEMRRLLSLVRHVRGVCDVENYTTVSPSRKQSHRIRARNLQAAMNELIASEKVSVAVFDGVAVLAGTVRSARDLGEAEWLARAHPDIRRVVNRLSVRKPR